MNRQKIGKCVTGVVVLLALLIGAFYLGRKTAPEAKMPTGPKTREVAQAVNALQTFADQWKEAEADEVKEKERVKAGRAAATETGENDFVRVSIEKVYRGAVPARDQPFTTDEDKPKKMTGYECLAVRFRVENISKTSIVDAQATTLYDNFGNEYRTPDDADPDEIRKILGLPESHEFFQLVGTVDQMNPGESTKGFRWFAKPLPNADWFVCEFKSSTSDGKDSKPFYVKIPKEKIVSLR